MTKLTDDLLLKALRATPGWHTATSLQISDSSIANSQALGIAQAA
jgi:hypothetical protein